MKMYCIFSKESLKLIQGVRGKMASQAGHAFLHAYWDSLERFPEYAEQYRESEHVYKITCVVDTNLELEKMVTYKDKCGFTMVTDAGLTVFKEPTTTCVGIGPIPEELCDSLKHLKLLV